MTVSVFTPRHDLLAKQNLEEFCRLAKEEITLWDVDFSSDVWTTHGSRVRFVALEHRGRHPTAAIPVGAELKPPMGILAKAYLRYTHHLRPKKNVHTTVSAFQLLDAALRELDGNADPVCLRERHFSRAFELIVSLGYKNKAAIGLALEHVARNLFNWCITPYSSPLIRHPFKGELANESSKTLSTRAGKLPDDDALFALAEIFANYREGISTDEDVFVTSSCALLLSAPMRVGEISWWPLDLIRSEPDSRGVRQIFLSYYSPKTSEFVRKEIPGVMAEHAAEALRRLASITAQGRLLATHLESGSDLFFRHPDCPDVSEDDLLSIPQLLQALGFADRTSAQGFLHRHTGSHKSSGWTLRSLWKVILKANKEKNPHFPYQVRPELAGPERRLKMSESLICLRAHQLSDFSTSPVLLVPYKPSSLAARIARADTIKKTTGSAINLSIFTKHGYHGLRLRSHQLRHFLNTAAEESGVSIENITKWSTRASLNQTRVYLHQTDSRKAEKASETLGLARPALPEPLTEQEYRLQSFGPIIVTRYGICTHDYTLTPCRKHAECLSCSELLLCKGHRRSIEAIHVQRNKLMENLTASQVAIDSGQRAASRWHEAHKADVIRLDQLLAMMTDAGVADGTPIQMVGKDFSHQSRILAAKPGYEAVTTARKSLADSYGADVSACLQMLLDEE